MIVTAVQSYGYRALVTIDTQGATPASLGDVMTLWRITGTRRAQVAGAVGIPAAGTVVVDVAAELGRDIAYQVVTGNGASATSDPVRIVGPALSDLGPACLVTQLVSGDTAPVAVVEWRSLDRAVQGEEITIPGRPEAVLLADVEMLPTSAPELLTVTPDAAVALDGLLAAGEVVLLRCSDPTYPDAYLSVRQRSTARITRTGLGRRHTLTATHHTHPSMGTRAQGDTLGVLHRAVPGTLGDIATRWPGALLDIASADLLSEVGP